MVPAGGRRPLADTDGEDEFSRVAGEDPLALAQLPFPLRLPVILDSLISVFLVIALGWVLRRTLVPSEEAWHGFEAVSYYVLVPVLIGKTLADSKLAEVPFARLGLVLVATVLILGAVLIALRPLLERLGGIAPPAFTSLFQGALRWNSFIALAVAANLYGGPGVTLAAVAIASLIPLLNVLTVLVMRRYGTHGGNGSLIRGLATNPFILGTLIGLVLNVTGLPIPRAINLGIDILGKCALGAGLLLVGAGLRLQDLQRPNLALVLSIALKLLAAPLTGAGLGWAVGLSGMPVTITVICLGVPTAGAAYIMARKMGGDAPLMAAIITAQTLVSMLTLPILIGLFS